MSRIRSCNTRPEVKVRKFLFLKGLRYRINYSIEGRPDIVFTKIRKVIFINGCFWHRHNCKNSVIPRSNKEFWIKKLNSNVERDAKVKESLQNAGWDVKIIWECEIEENFDHITDELMCFLEK